MIRIRSISSFLSKSRKLCIARLCSTSSGLGCSSEPKLPTTTDVIIVGGGVTGCSILYQLSKKGVNAVLLERGKVTCGTTFR